MAYEEAWAGRVAVAIGGRAVCFLGRAALLKNKRASGRPKDLVDADLLEGHGA